MPRRRPVPYPCRIPSGCCPKLHSRKAASQCREHVRPEAVVGFPFSRFSTGLVVALCRGWWHPVRVRANLPLDRCLPPPGASSTRTSDRTVRNCRRPPVNGKAHTARPAEAIYCGRVDNTSAAAPRAARGRAGVQPLRSTAAGRGGIAVTEVGERNGRTSNQRHIHLLRASFG